MPAQPASEPSVNVAVTAVSEHLVIAGPALRAVEPQRTRLDPRAAEPPGLLTPIERRLLQALGERSYRGDGVIIDGGSFLGSSVAASAVGLARNPRLSGMDFAGFPDGKPIHAYERGFLEPGAGVNTRRRFGGIDYGMGEDFLPILQRTIEPFADHVALHVGDLKLQRWGGHPIEICFLDVCKTIDLNAHIAAEFYPSLLQGGWLINQDYFFHRLPWIKVTLGYLADYLRWEGQVYTTSVYTVAKPVPAEVAAWDPFTHGSLDECLAYHDAVAFEGLSQARRFFLDLSRAYLMALKGGRERALAHLDDVGERYGALVEDGAPDDHRSNRFKFERARRHIETDTILRVP